MEKFVFDIYIWCCVIDIVCSSQSLPHSEKVKYWLFGIGKIHLYNHLGWVWYWHAMLFWFIGKHRDVKTYRWEYTLQKDQTESSWLDIKWIKFDWLNEIQPCGKDMASCLKVIKSNYKNVIRMFFSQGCKSKCKYWILTQSQVPL